MQKIRAYPWPGNVRELENILERSLLFTSGSVMTEPDLEIPTNTNNVDDWRGVKENTAAKVELSFLESALKQHQGDVKKVAENMGITSRAVYGKLKKYDIKPTEYRKL